jgi:hypothetical protein
MNIYELVSELCCLYMVMCWLENEKWGLNEICRKYQDEIVISFAAIAEVLHTNKSKIL